MAFGLGVLRLSPTAFWAMTPRELHAALEGVYGPCLAPLSRSLLDGLLRAFSDDGG
jgi:uncharacterized phage protein (TIGR02216 family)